MARDLVLDEEEEKAEVEYEADQIKHTMEISPNDVDDLLANDEEEDGDNADKIKEASAFRSEVMSNFFFLAATIFYLIQSINDLRYEKHTQGIPQSLIELNDNEQSPNFTRAPGYDDDYVWGDDIVFTTKRSGYDVSSYMIIYFCGALCFILSGIADCFNPYNTSCFVGAFIIGAGFFDLVASIFVDCNPNLSNTLDLISSHLYFCEAIQLFWAFNRCKNKLSIQIWTYTGCFLFGLGAFLDLVTGYIAQFDENVDYSNPFAILSLFGSTCWLACAIITSGLTIYDQYYDDSDDIEDVDSEEQELLHHHPSKEILCLEAQKRNED